MSKAPNENLDELLPVHGWEQCPAIFPQQAERRYFRRLKPTAGTAPELIGPDGTCLVFDLDRWKADQERQRRTAAEARGLDRMKAAAARLEPPPELPPLVSDGFVYTARIASQIRCEMLLNLPGAWSGKSSRAIVSLAVLAGSIDFERGPFRLEEPFIFEGTASLILGYSSLEQRPVPGDPWFLRDTLVPARRYSIADAITETREMVARTRTVESRLQKLEAERK
jgi:hypothetical protein